MLADMSAGVQTVLQRSHRVAALTFWSTHQHQHNRFNSAVSHTISYPAAARLIAPFYPRDTAADTAAISDVVEASRSTLCRSQDLDYVIEKIVPALLPRTLQTCRGCGRYRGRDGSDQN